ncbi:MAG: hypothetical protein WBX22_08190 [Silvibacterium sp.]|jgi:hypothetical protein
MVEGDAGILKQLARLMVDFEPRFVVMPGTQARTVELLKANPCEAIPRDPIAE